MAPSLAKFDPVGINCLVFTEREEMERVVYEVCGVCGEGVQPVMMHCAYNEQGDKDVWTWCLKCIQKKFAEFMDTQAARDEELKRNINAVQEASNRTVINE